MYNRMYKFFSDNSLIYSLQFGFRQKYSTVHAVISLTESIRKNLDEGNIGCGIFVNLQKAFDIFEHDILLSKLEHCGLANEWFKSYPSNKKQYVSINGYDSNLADVKFCVPQGSVLCFSKSVYRLNKYVNLDFKNLIYWLNADRITLNVKN